LDVSVYLDASALVAILTDDPFTERTTAFLRTFTSVLIVSDFAAAEFSATVARHVRIQKYSPEHARTAFSTFDLWSSRGTQRVHVTQEDIASAEIFVRRLDLTLRAPDAIHIAISQRTADHLLTFDRKMAEAARALGTEVAQA
jgi:predicted nucleic acid-binding protein